jgi:histidyl-tRNA synthetase
MTDKRQFRAIKGTRDILPPDSALWNWFERTAREVFESYGFGEIRLPIFEETELFARSIGVDTDVVGKEMYTFEDHGLGELERLRTVIIFRDPDIENPYSVSLYAKQLAEFIQPFERGLSEGSVPATPDNKRALENLKMHALGLVDGAQSPDGFRLQVNLIREALRVIRFGGVISLRPEATASVVRAYIEHGMHTLPGNRKLYYVGPMFRRERPQKGRYRQFYQVGAEVLGQSDAPAIDAEILEMLVVFFKRVGLTQTTLYVNSIGCQHCRSEYVELLRNRLREIRDDPATAGKLGPDSQRRIETNPLRVLDSKLPEEQEIIESLPHLSDHLCADCVDHFAKLKEELALRGIAYEENWRLVRGLDYYTRTTFEVTAAAGLGSQNAVCGGGRYDGLAELLGGQPTKGIGFAIGTDRAILSIQEGSRPAAAGRLPLAGLAVYVAWMGANSYPAAVAIARKLRESGLAVELPPEEMKFKKSLGLADKLGARYALIIGDDEVASQTYTLKCLADAEQKKMSESELIEYLESELRGTHA